MSNVPVSQRKQHVYLLLHDFYKVRKELYEFAENGFGFDVDRYREHIEKKMKNYSGSDVNKQEYYQRQLNKCNSFYSAVIYENQRLLIHYCTEVIDHLVHCSDLFKTNNPTLDVYLLCWNDIHYAENSVRTLQHLLQSVAETLPCDKNKFCYRSKLLSDYFDKVHKFIDMIPVKYGKSQIVFY